MNTYIHKTKYKKREDPITVSRSVALPEGATKHLTYPTLPLQWRPGLHGNHNEAGKAERLRGPKHVKEGLLNQTCLDQKAVRAKSVMVNLRYASGIHISPQVGMIEPVPCYRTTKSSMWNEPDGKRLLRLAGPRISPKALVEPDHWNSGLAKGRKSHANGDSIVVRTYTNEVSQSKTLDQPYDDSNMYSCGEAKTESAKVADIEIGKYNSLFHPRIYKIAYEIVKSKKGNTTPGVDNATLDGIGLPWIDKTIESMKNRSYKFQPAVRKYIPKPNGKLRPLGIPTPKDKVVQQAIRMLIEPLFEPHFLNSSHGFRPGRSAHTALREIRQWTGITWAIEGDIKGCFDNVDHHVLEQLLKNKIKDDNLIGLYWKAVNAGYVNNGSLEPHSLTGVPQGGVLSPFLSNVYMHELDAFVEELKSKYKHTPNKRGVIQNPEYTKILKRLEKLRAEGNGRSIREAELERDRIPSVIRTGTRIYYVRYADDWIIGVRGPKELAVKLKSEVEIFLRDKLRLELSKDKTAITHLPTEKAFFLGTIIRRHGKRYLEGLTKKRGQRRVRGSNSRIILECPVNKIVTKLVDQGYAHKSDQKPKAITKWIYMKPEEIILRYNAVIRGYLNYYSFVNNRNMLQRIVWILSFSAIFTFCRKWNISPRKVFKKLGNPPKYTKQVKAPTLKKGRKEVSYTLDRGDLSINTMKFDLIRRTSKEEEHIDPAKIKYFSIRSHFTLDKPCCVCGTDQNVEMHHIRHLRKDAPGADNRLKRLFLQVKRKQIPVCRPCHKVIHDGKYDGRKLGNLGKTVF